ncbi:MAG: 2,3-bisphosphoglycerate-independent phosphoglycerate mutase [Saprospiraceae bacterium]|nr:2,3-bisphosphoglycerate-independent phosphoglycerate mutase [Saprospiraceae bacterium]
MNLNRIMLLILDGWGKGQKPSADAIAQANTPVMDELMRTCPNSELVTFGEDVGLPEGQMGNSEVGHLNIGAGRIVYQELARINKSIRDGELQQHPVLLEAFQYAKANNKAVHFIGLLSDGGVHSHTKHLLALCEASQQQGLERVFVHAFMDGRDTDPKSGLRFLSELLQNIDNQSVKLNSIIGRYYAMDRDKRWERVKLAYDLLVNGIGEKTSDPLATVHKRYEAGETDEFLKPIICVDGSGNPVATIQAGDVVVCFNFRTDRPREITTVLTQKDIPEFGMSKLNLHYVCMTRYDESYKGLHVIFEKDNLNNTLGEVLSNAGLTQVRIAETEKYPHVTFFFSGGREEPFEGERRLMVPSPKVATYDLQPEMSAEGITEAIITDIENNQPNYICLNFANTDMVGHTGVFSAAMKAAETVDACLGRVLACGKQYGYEAIVIADHGNSDYLINEDGTPNTAHTMNPVPFIYVGKPGAKVSNGKLADIAPTILGLMGIDLPIEMNGNNLISK